jgi:hypothetical protein
MIAADIIYQDAAVGLVDGTGHARPLVGGDRFAGFAEETRDNSAGSAADKNVRTRIAGKVKLAVTGAVITDVGQPVYATDDDTFAFNPVGGTFVGLVDRFVSSGVVIVEFDIFNLRDPYGDDDQRETIAANKTLDAEDTGKTFFVTTDAVIITLPATAVAGLGIRVVNIAAFGTVAVNLSPAAADKIAAPDVAGSDNVDLVNTKATARRGDFAVVNAGHADGWVVSAMRGIWA